MTQEEFERLNPIICTTYGIMGYNMYDAMVIQGQFLSSRTFILETLTNEEAQFVSLRYGVNDQCPMTINDVASKMGINIPNAKKIELRSIRKLRHPSRIRLLKQYTDKTIDQDDLNRITKQMGNIR